MKPRLPYWLPAACSVALGSVSPAQDPPLPPSPQQKQGETSAPDLSWSVKGYRTSGQDREDYTEIHLLSGFRFLVPGLKLEVRGTNALILADREAWRSLLDAPSTSGLPHRGIAPPDPRRSLSPDEIRARLDRTLRAVGRPEGLPMTRTTEQGIDVLRYLYFEGGVTVVRDGLEVLRCDRMWLSPLDDRIVVENAELRYVSGTGHDNQLVVRGPKLVKQGGRWTGRDVTVTTCTAAEPHAALAAGEVEIIERDREFEVFVRGHTLQLGGTSVLPLPDAHIFTGSQSEFPIKSAGAGYSGKEGAKGAIVVGTTWNQLGGGLHNWLLGRPEHEFRGEWEVGVGWIQERGVPLEGAFSYGAKGLYEGRTEGFWLDDRGTDLREIQANFDGSPIDNQNRGLVRSQNRVHFGEAAHLDLVAFHAADPAVYSEFFGGDYRTAEVPETSAYFHAADGNRLVTVGTRFNLDEFSYRDDRALAEKFTEELPVVTFHWLAQPIAETPWGTPIVVDMATEIGQRRSDYDDLAGTRVADRTLRADQYVELSAPFHLGPLNFRPFGAARGTFYDNAIDGESEGRIAFDAGVQLGTRLSRTWSWQDEDGPHGVRHVVAPRVSYLNRFRVDDDPSEFFAFDATDALREQELVRVELRNLVQTMVPGENGKKEPRDFVFLDLAQDVFPDKDRDNAGETLGLFYYDLLLRPRFPWLSLQTFALAVYGDHDWQDGLRTLDAEVQVGRIAGITWTGDYRTDSLVDGAVGLTASTRLMDRWDIYAGSQRDLDLDEWLSYSFGLRRNDHDWSILLSANYNPYTDETSFQLSFTPRFGGMTPRRDRFAGGDVQGNFATSY
ncbi:MAG TPA: hypothetical protein VFD82_21415 [Planctomycetota bacterium]|nr:hypothetical protein [Planctomycetota bacterium]